MLSAHDVEMILKESEKVMKDPAVSTVAGYTLDNDGHISEKDLENFKNTCIDEGKLGFGEQLYRTLKHVSELEGDMSAEKIKQVISDKLGKDITDGATMEGVALAMCHEYQITEEDLTWLFDQVMNLGPTASTTAFAAFLHKKPEELHGDSFE